MKKYNILIWGTGLNTKKLLNHLKNCNIIAFVETQKTKNIFNNIQVITPEIIKQYDYDYILVSNIYYAQIRQTCKEIEVADEKKIIFLFDESLYGNIEFKYIISQMIDDDFEVLRKIEWNASKKIMPYVSCQKDKMVYVFNSRDCVISDSIYVYDFKTFQESDILLFFDLTKEYYGIEAGGIFFDIGANIGTTSLYIKKYLVPDICVYAFEPSIDNYKLFKINCILNDISMDDIVIENVAVSNTNGELILGLSDTNMGDHRIFSSLEQSNEKGRKSEVVNAIKLSDYIKNNKIKIDDINYLWIDTQAHEAYVLEGLIEVLKQRKIPMYIEFWIVKLQANNTMNLLIKYLCEIYDSFICVSSYNKGYTEPIPIEKLREFALNYEDELFDMFLI